MGGVAPDLKTLKNSLNASRSSTSLTGGGATSSSSSASRRPPAAQSSRESQKLAEKTAWMRRKEYDPRKSVASAKSAATTSSSTSQGKQKTKGEESRSSCSTPEHRKPSRRLRRETYTSSAEDISQISIDSAALESDGDSLHSDTIASASRELAKDLRTLAGGTGATSADLHTAVSAGLGQLPTAFLPHCLLNYKWTTR